MERDCPVHYREFRDTPNRYTLRVCNKPPPCDSHVSRPCQMCPGRRTVPAETVWGKGKYSSKPVLTFHMSLCKHGWASKYWLPSTARSRNVKGFNYFTTLYLQKLGNALLRFAKHFTTELTTERISQLSLHLPENVMNYHSFIPKYTSELCFLHFTWTHTSTDAITLSHAYLAS